MENPTTKTTHRRLTKDSKGHSLGSVLAERNTSGELQRLGLEERGVWN